MSASTRSIRQFVNLFSSWSVGRSAGRPVGLSARRTSIPGSQVRRHGNKSPVCFLSLTLSCSLFLFGRSVGRSICQSVGRSCQPDGRSAGWSAGRPGRSVDRSVGRGRLVCRSVGGPVGHSAGWPDGGLVGRSAGQIGWSIGLPVSRLVARSVRGKEKGGHGDEMAGGAGSSRYQ